MGKLSNKLRSAEDGTGRKYVSYWCQGCESFHTITVNNPNGQSWQWNGNVDKPTFSPSVLSRSGHYAPHFNKDGECWCTFDTRFPEHTNDKHKFKCGICHTFITDGKVQFLGDCTHQFAGQTLELPDLPKDEEDD